MKTVKFQMEALTCPSCIKKIERALSQQDGVEDAQVLFSSNKVKVVFDGGNVNSEGLKEVIEKLGYQVLSVKENIRS